MLPHRVRADWPQQQCSQIYPADVSWCGDDREHTCRSECTDCCLTPVRPAWSIAYNYGGWMHDHKITALRSCIKVEVAVLGANKPDGFCGCKATLKWNTQNNELRTRLHFLCNGQNMNPELLNSHYTTRWLSVTIPGHHLMRPSSLSVGVCAIKQFSEIQTPLLFDRATGVKSTFDQKSETRMIASILKEDLNT